MSEVFALCTRKPHFQMQQFMDCTMGCICLCKIVCSLGINVHGKVGKNIGIVTYYLASPLNYSHKAGQVCVFYIARVNRNGGLICMKQQPMFCSKIICNGLLNKGRVQLYYHLTV